MVNKLSAESFALSAFFYTFAVDFPKRKTPYYNKVYQYEDDIKRVTAAIIICYTVAEPTYARSIDGVAIPTLLAAT